MITKREAERQYRDHVLPEVKKQYETSGRIDKPARAEAWNNFTDSLCKDRQITMKQYETWGHPK
jgi:hypothetical protein